MFETRSQSWSEAGLLDQVSPRAARAGWDAALLSPLFIGVVVPTSTARACSGSKRKGRLAGGEHGGRLITVVVLLMLGWAIARDFGRAFGPALFRRMDPAAAGTSVPDPPCDLAIRAGGVEYRGRQPARSRRWGFYGRDPGLGGPADARQPVRGHGPAQRPPVPGWRSRAPQGGPLAGQIEGTISSRAWTTDVRDRGGLDYGARQRGAQRGRRAQPVSRNTLRSA